jgi:hypothetical protein
LKIPLTQNGGRLDTTEAESPSLISETPKSADVLRANIGMYNPLRKDINSLIGGANGSAFSRVIKPIAINRVASPSNYLIGKNQMGYNLI